MGKVIRRIIQVALVLLIVGAAGYIGHKEYQKRLLERVEWLLWFYSKREL